MPADVTICVLDLDGGEMLEACLASIYRQTEPVEIVIVDNGSRVPVTERIASAADIRVIRWETNRGFAAGANAAIGTASTPLVALVNNDVELEPEWVSTLRAQLEHPDVAAAQSIILGLDGRIDSAGIEIHRGRFIQIAHGQQVDRAELETSPWGVAATAAMFRRSALPSSPLDERLFAWYEDVDLAARLRDAGWSARLVPRPLAHHRGSATAAALPDRGEPLRVRNRYLVARSRRVGSVRALLIEDMRRVAGATLRGRFSLAGAVVRGVRSGLSEPPLAPNRVRSAPQ